MSKETQVKAEFKPSRITERLPLSLIISVQNPATFLQGFVSIASESWFLSREPIGMTRGGFSLLRLPGLTPHPGVRAPSLARAVGLCKSKSPGGSRGHPDPAAHWILQGERANLEGRGRSSELGVKT